MTSSPKRELAASVPTGFRLAGVHCGLKRNPTAEDLTLILSDAPSTAAAVYTKNIVVAAPVMLDRQRTPSDNIRAVVVNSGNANACTGARGLKDATKMTELTAKSCDVRPDQVLVMSTGIIGEQLNMEAVTAGITAAARKLGNDQNSLVSAARGMMTTDTVHKTASAQVQLQGETYQITGLAKGSGMIGPRLATMLGVILTDAPMTAADAQAILSSVVEESFNCISVEGHASTNDTVVLLAKGSKAVAPLRGDALSQFSKCLLELCIELARSIPDDGEGASHLIQIEVTGCRTRDDARQIARTVADSPLVKTAIAGADPNWGRIVSAAGYAGVDFDPQRLELRLNGSLLYRQGTPVEFDASAVAKSIQENRQTDIKLTLDEGDSSIRFWTSDLTAEYVKINADYHT